MRSNRLESSDTAPAFGRHGAQAPPFLAFRDQEPPRYWWALRYGTAALAVIAGFELRMVITDWAGPGLPTYITFYPAVMVAALFGGLGPGLAATALAGLMTAYWILPPEGLAIASAVERVGLALFAGMGLFMSAVAELYRRSRRSAAAYERQLAVRVTETRYRSYIEVTGQLGWTTNAEGEVVEDVPAWRAFTGQSREEVQGWGWTSALHPDDVETTSAIWRQAVAERRKYETEYRIRRRDGVYRHFLARGVPVFRDDGRVREWVGTCIDITERKQAEEALRQTKEDWEQTFNTVPDLVAILDNQHRVVRANRAMAERLGAAPEQCVGLHCYQAIHDAGQPPESCPHAHTCRDGREHTAEVYEARLGGHFLVTTTPRFDAQGRLVGSVHVARDITHFKRAEGLLRTRLRLSELAQRGDMEELIQIALDDAERHTGSSIGYFHFVDEDQQNLTLQAWSTNTLRHLCQAEGKGRHYPIREAGVWVDCFHARSPVIHNDYASLPHKKGLPEGHPPVVRDLGVPVVRGERVVAIMGVGNKPSDYTQDDVDVLQELASVTTDLVAYRRAEDALRASLREKEVMLKEIHHRVKNNMQVISSLVSLQADGSQDAALRGTLQDVRDRVRSMALVHEKLYQSSSLAQVEFAEYARSLLNYLWRAHGAVASRVRLNLDLQPVPFSIEMAVPCGLILNELAGNALKHAFSKRDAEVRRREDAERVAEREKGREGEGKNGDESEVRVTLGTGSDGRVTLRVSDNGSGLPAGVDWRNSRSLGLRLVQMLTGQIGGTLEVATREGEGTQFEVTFGA